MELHEATKLLRKRKPTREQSLQVASMFPWPKISKYHRKNLTQAERSQFRHEHELNIRQSWERENFGEICTTTWFRGCANVDILTT